MHPVSSEITFGFAGVLAYQGHLNLALVIIIGSLAELAGSYASYAAGRAGRISARAGPARPRPGCASPCTYGLTYYYYWTAGYVSEGRYRLGQALARARGRTVWRAQGLLLASYLAAVSGDRGAARPLLAEGTGLARQLNDPATSAWVQGLAAWRQSDLQRAAELVQQSLRAHPDQARLHLARPGCRLGLRLTTGR